MATANPETKNDNTPPDTQQTQPRDPLADMMTCLIPAIIAALPAFLDAFFKCISGGGGEETGYAPGDRHRCK